MRHFPSPGFSVRTFCDALLSTWAPHRRWEALDTTFLAPAVLWMINFWGSVFEKFGKATECAVWVLARILLNVYKLAISKSNWCVDKCVHAQSISRVWLFATLWTITGQAPLSMEFSRQEYWSGLPFPTRQDKAWNPWLRRHVCQVQM